MAAVVLALFGRENAVAVDATGTWAVTAPCIFTPGLMGTLVAAGDQFTLDLSATVGFPCVVAGTIDAQTGQMSGTGCVFGGLPTTLSGTATDTCLTGEISPALDACTFRGVRACVDCDDGNPCTTDGCATEACAGSPGCVHVPVPSATACDDGTVCTVGDVCQGSTCTGAVVNCGDGNVCTTDACDPALGCVPSPNTGAPCSDGNACTAGDACSASGTCAAGAPLACAACERCAPLLGCHVGPRAGCRPSLVPHRSLLVVQNRDPDTKDALVWKWRAGAETAADAFGDPLATDAYTLCAFDDAAGNAPGLLLRATAPAGETCPFGPAGEPCWSARGRPPGRRGFRYRDAGLLLPDGLTDVRLVPGKDRRASITVRGRGGNLQIPTPLAVTPPVTVQFQGTHGVCWETTHPTPLVNREDRLRARGGP